jgi:anion-transporting  ArsA/GET3 family ATPase
MREPVSHAPVRFLLAYHLARVIADVLADRRIVICAGSGGVGKTTTAAALAMGMATRGLRVAVVTIDPAKRLANSLGLETLGNEPHRVDPQRFAGHGVEVKGELWAMMLDPKSTFDDLIARLAQDAKTRDEILANPIYQQLSSAVAGSQEFTAIAKLYELDHEGDFDLIVLDTPPSRNALDFLDAPGRLQSFFQGRAIRLFLRPAGFGGRLIGAGTGVVFSVMKRATGIDLLQDLSVFFRALGGIVDGFVERADHVGALLSDPGTTFVIVTSPEPEPVEEALHFHAKLRDASMPFGALVVNRVRAPAQAPLSAQARAALGDDLADRVALASDEITALAERDRAQIDHLHEELGFPPVIEIPQFPDDVHDVDGLLLVADRLFA